MASFSTLSAVLLLAKKNRPPRVQVAPAVLGRLIQAECGAHFTDEVRSGVES